MPGEKVCRVVNIAIPHAPSVWAHRSMRLSSWVGWPQTKTSVRAKQLVVAFIMAWQLLSAHPVKTVAVKNMSLCIYNNIACVFRDASQLKLLTVKFTASAFVIPLFIYRSNSAVGRSLRGSSKLISMFREATWNNLLHIIYHKCIYLSLLGSGLQFIYPSIDMDQWWTD